MDRKQDVRERIWGLMERRGVSRFPGPRGRIPNFVGAEAAAERLATLQGWREAEAIKANPDSPQLPVRTRALAEGKRVYMAVPRLREKHPFLVLDPERLDVAPRRAASISGASRHGIPVGVDEVPHLDLVVCGTVAADRRGARVGKGGGYADLELAILTEAGAIDERTMIVTTVHPVQVVDGRLPETAHDVRVDRIVTPDRTISCRRTSRPPGILWDQLDEARIEAIPVLRRLDATRR